MVDGAVAANADVIAVCDDRDVLSLEPSSTSAADCVSWMNAGPFGGSDGMSCTNADGVNALRMAGAENCAPPIVAIAPAALIIA